MKWIKQIILVIVLTFMVLLFFNLFGHGKPTFNEVIVEVDYDKQWVGVITNGDQTISWQAPGRYSQRISRPQGVSPWHISVSAQKMDSTNDKLTVKLMKINGEVLMERSTNMVNGVVAFSVTYD